MRKGISTCITSPLTATNRKLRQPSSRGLRLKRNLRMKMKNMSPSQRSRWRKKMRQVSGASVCPTACGSNTMRSPGCLPKYCLIRMVMSRSSADPASQPPRLRMNPVRNTPKAPEMLLTMLNSERPVLPAPIDRMYSSACNRVTRVFLALRTRRLPETPTTPGSSKWRVALRTMSLSKDVSPSSAMTISPVAMESPALSDETRPPRCHLGSTTRFRLACPAKSLRALRAASKVGRF